MTKVQNQLFCFTTKKHLKNTENCEYDDFTATESWLNCRKLKSIDYDLIQSSHRMSKYCRVYSKLLHKRTSLLFQKHSRPLSIYMHLAKTKNFVCGYPNIVSNSNKKFIGDRHMQIYARYYLRKKKLNVPIYRHKRKEYLRVVYLKAFQPAFETSCSVSIRRCMYFYKASFHH